MAKSYPKVKKFGWTCVAGKLGILCHRDAAPVQSVSFISEDMIKLVDANCMSPSIEGGNRVHTICAYEAIMPKKRGNS